MAATSYYYIDYNEENLESQALEIDGAVLVLQAQIRGFLSRTRIGFTTCVANSAIKHKSQGSLVQESRYDSVTIAATPDHVVPNFTDKLCTEQLEKFGFLLHRFDDPDLTERRFEEVPDGWTLYWTDEHVPYFYHSKTGTTTWTHPRQHDASLLFKKPCLDFNLTTAFQRWITYVKGSLEQRGSENPTIGELLMYYDAATCQPGIVSRWWKDRDPGRSADQLCDVCLHVDFDAILHSTNAWKDNLSIDLGLLRSITKKRHCAFCRLVVKTLLHGLEEFASLFGKLTWPCHIVSSTEYLSQSQKIRCLYITVQISEYFYPLNKFRHRKIHQILQNENKPSEQRNNDLRLLKSQIDFELIKSWLQMCERQHHSMSFQSGVVDSTFETPDDDQTFTRLPC